MSLPTGLTTGLAFLPQWLADTKDANAWDSLLCAWVRASRWRTAGVVWPTETAPTLALLARGEQLDALPALPAELGDVSRALRTGNSTVVWQLPGSAGRLYTLLQPAGRPIGLVWAERGPGEPWTEADRHYLTLSVRLMERSPALVARIGALIDPDRLLQRLGDASIIAGRMAHDFDNILTGIMGFSDLTGPLVASIPQAAKFVSEIGKVGQRGIQFTQQLHQLSRSGQSHPQPGSIAAALAREEARLRSAPGFQGALIQTQLPPELMPVAMDIGPLSIVLGHILENAIEASPPGGRILIAARSIDLNPMEAKAYLGRASAGNNIEVTVQDQGAGIKPELRARLFAEPFLTTKVRHRGLGLAIVYRTLYAHGGAIRIESVAAPETGTRVRILLPVAAPRPAAVRPLAAATTFGG